MAQSGGRAAGRADYREFQIPIARTCSKLPVPSGTSAPSKNTTRVLACHRISRDASHTWDSTGNPHDPHGEVGGWDGPNVRVCISPTYGVAMPWVSAFVQTMGWPCTRRSALRPNQSSDTVKTLRMQCAFLVPLRLQYVSHASAPGFDG